MFDPNSKSSDTLSGSSAKHIVRPGAKNTYIYIYYIKVAESQTFFYIFLYFIKKLLNMNDYSIPFKTKQKGDWFWYNAATKFKSPKMYWPYICITFLTSFCLPITPLQFL